MGTQGHFPSTIFPEIHLISGKDIEMDKIMELDGEGNNNGVHFTSLLNPEVVMTSKDFMEGELPANEEGVEASVGGLCEPDQNSKDLAPKIFIMDITDPEVGSADKPLDQGKKDFNNFDLYYFKFLYIKL